MVTQSNFQLTQQLISNYYDFFNKKDYQGMLSLLSHDIVHEINQGGSEKGIEAFHKFLNTMDFHYDERLTNIEICVNQKADRAAAEFVCHGCYKNTANGLPPAKNQKYEIAVGTFFEIQSGKISRITNYYNLNNWIAQVGQ
jgi:steroid delta-isomerase-like uncharacterized protein